MLGCHNDPAIGQFLNPVRRQFSRVGIIAAFILKRFGSAGVLFTKQSQNSN